MTLSSSAIHSVAGAFSGLIGCFAVQPLDVLKTRLQQPNFVTPTYNVIAAATTATTSTTAATTFNPTSTLRSSRSKVPSFIGISKQIYSEQGWTGFWRGSIPTLVRNVPGTALYFLTLDYTRTALSLVSPPFSPSWIHLSAGAFARAWVGFLMMPASVIKTRFESSLYNYSSIGQAVRGIYVKEGIKGLFSGFGATALRDVPFAGVYLVIYEYSKKKLFEIQTQHWLHLSLSAALAGIVATVITQPFDLIKTKVQVAPSCYPNSYMASKALFKQYGIKGFFKGLGPRLMRKPLHAMITWTIYEESVALLKTYRN